MIVKFLSQTKMWILLLIPTLGILLWVNVLMIPEIEPLPSETFQMPIYSQLYELFGDLIFTRIARLSALLLLVVQAFLIIRLNFNYAILEEKKSFLPAFIYLIICSSFLPLMRFHPIYLINIIILVIIDILFSIRKQENAFTQVLIASMLISLGSFIYLNILFYMPFIWVGLIILRNKLSFRDWIFSFLGLILMIGLTKVYFVYFSKLHIDVATSLIVYYLIIFLWTGIVVFRYGINWREWLVSVFGLSLPVVFAQLFYAFVNNQPKELAFTAALNLLFDNFRLCYNTSYFVEYFIIAVLVLSASIYTLIVYKFKNISTRNYLVMLFCIFMISIPIYIFVPSASMELMHIAAIPVTFVISGFLSELKNKWIADSLFVALLVLVFIINLINI